MNKLLLFFVFVFVLISGNSYAEIINVPDDQETIQDGIDAADHGDTVQVAPGEYQEIINFHGKLISVIGNPEDPNEVVIDGGEFDESVIIFRNSENENSVLSGLTIQNGNSDYGGGIYISEASPTLSHLVVQDNYAANGGGLYIRDSRPTLNHLVVQDNNGGTGGAIYLDDCDDVILQNMLIFNNSSERDGGGIYARSSQNIMMDKLEIIENSTGSRGGGIYATSSSVEIRHTVITHNHAETNAGGAFIASGILSHVLIAFNDSNDEGGAIQGRGGSIELINCTIFGNEAPVGSVFGVDAGYNLILTNTIIRETGENPLGDELRTITVNYSNIDNGQEFLNNGNLEWGEGNIDEDPSFVDPENGDFLLAVDSPCIDTGDPESDLDPDGTRSDMGAFPYFQRGAVVGYVFDFMTEQPLEGVLVTASFGTNDLSDEDGHFVISPTRLIPFDLTASLSQYIDSTMTDLEVELDDTLSITFNLLHAELEPSIENIETRIDIGESEQFEFRIGNPGNGVLDWSVETRFRGNAGVDPWVLRQSYQFGQQLENDLLYGVAFVDSTFYVAAANRGYPTVYVMNLEGALIDTFEQPGENNRGIKDFTYDGELLWGASGNTVFGMTLEGEVITSFDAPYNPSTGITWDSDRELLWICSTLSNPVGMDRDGNLIRGMEISRDDLRIYALAYYEEDDDDSPLYIFSREEETNLQTLHKHSFETGEKTFVTYLEPEAGGSPKGAFITNQLDGFSWVFMSVADDDEGDRVDIWQLAANMSWAIINPVAGVINPDEEQEMMLTLDASGLIQINYPAEMVFSHNGFGHETIIPIDLTVMPLDVEGLDEIQLPLEFALTDVFPNPFNSIVRLNYTIPRSSNISIKLYDVTGSLVDILIGRAHESGRHNVIWDASISPSGIYFARMESGGFSQTVKLMLMK